MGYLLNEINKLGLDGIYIQQENSSVDFTCKEVLDVLDNDLIIVCSLNSTSSAEDIEKELDQLYDHKAIRIKVYPIGGSRLSG